jgi:lysozyme family protein
MSKFDEFFTRLIGNEGGYVFNKDDPGGETNWGISKRSYPNVDIKNLTREGAKAIYYRDFWQAAQMDQLDPAIAYQCFDAAVNHGISRAKKLLQQAVNVTVDGVIGAKTIGAVRQMDKNDVLFRYDAFRLMFYADPRYFDDRQWLKFGRGWVNRSANNLLYAAEDN